jgi:hypothetical protein
MSEIHVNADDVTPAPAPTPVPTPAPHDPAQVKAIITTLLNIAKAVAAMTPTKVDDQAVAFLAGLVTQDWFVNLLVTVLNATTPAAKEKALDAAHLAIKAKIGA